jgi:tRNA A37 threonylcarbamoyladenosine modification protein TsaB
MILFINTTNKNKIEIALKEEGSVLARKEFEAKHSQAEKLLPEIEKMLKGKKIKLSDISGIEVANVSQEDTGFTSLRIGVVTANALGYALGVPVKGKSQNKIKQEKLLEFDVVKPIYNREPNITKPVH